MPAVITYSGVLGPYSPITFTRASTATYFNASGVLTTAAVNEGRLDYDPSTLAPLGFLVEEQRTNSVRNSTAQGAVAGSPGTLPTNWFSVNAGLTRTIVGTGTENGITYIDIRFNGTTTSQFANVTPEPINNIVASAGQVWTTTAYIKLVSGSLANISSVGVTAYYFDSGSAFLSSSPAAVTLTSSLQRATVSATAPASTAFIQPGIYFNASAPSGQAIDITLRIGLPQLELGAFATSVIPTTTTALTRSADVASVNTLSPWWNSAAGTFYTEFSLPSIGRAARLFAVDDGAINNMIDATVSATNAVAIEGIAAGVYSGFAGVVNTITANTTQKAAFTFSTSASETACLNAGTVGSNNITLPSVSLTRLLLGQQANSAATLGGYLRRLTFYPRQLSNAEIQALTA